MSLTTTTFPVSPSLPTGENLPHYDVCIFTDPGADFDDQLMLHYFFTHKSRECSVLLIIGGKGQYRHWESFAAEKNTTMTNTTVVKEDEDVPECTATTVFVASPGFAARCFPQFSAARTAKVVAQANLPCHAALPDGVELQVKHEDCSPAFNDAGLQPLLDALRPRTVVRAVTSRECMQPENMPNPTMLQSLGLNEEQIRTVQKTTFSMLLGRMRPDHPCAFVAEGLVHVGVKGTTTHLATAALAATGVDVEDIPVIPQTLGLLYPEGLSPDRIDALYKACVRYVNALGKHCTRPDTCSYLFNLECMVYMLTGVVPVDREGNLCYSTDESGEFYDMAYIFPLAFEKFQSLQVCSPAYDYVAMRESNLI